MDREFIGWCLRQPEIPYERLAAQCPDFLVISPPKTGSSWLAANLRCHPEAFVPEIKEVKYFSLYWKWLDLNWYLNHFGAAAGRIRGEASPSYAILPVERIRTIRRLMPHVKLIFLMRDPVARAWSHAKHNYRYREANFTSCSTAFDRVSDAAWQENFAHEWALVSGDYLGQLRRWLSVFPREQLYLGFYESIASSPKTLLREIFTFLGLAPDVDLEGFPVAERILPGLPGELSPALQLTLRHLLGDRSQELASYLRTHLGIQTPPAWSASLSFADARPGCGEPDGAGLSARATAVFSRELDDRYLCRVMAHEETFPSSPRLVVAGYRGHDLFFHRGQFYAQTLNSPDGGEKGREEVALLHCQDPASYICAPSLTEVKEAVNQHAFERMRTVLRDMAAAHADIKETRGRLCRLEQRFSQAEAETHRIEQHLEGVEAAIVRLTPWYWAAVTALRKAWRRLRVALQRQVKSQVVRSQEVPSDVPASEGRDRCRGCSEHL